MVSAPGVTRSSNLFFALFAAAALLFAAIAPKLPISMNEKTAGEVNVSLAFLASPHRAEEFQALSSVGAIRFSTGGLHFEAAGIQMVFENPGAAAHLSAGLRLAGVANYYLGNNSADWHTALPTYGELKVTELYPGIHVRYENQEGSLKSTYTVAAGADPNAIRWRYQGAQEVRIDAGSGDLLIGGTGQARLVEQAPVAWQVIAGRRVAVEAAYQVGKDGLVGFALGAYNPTQALVIDPVISYSSFLAGTLADDADTVVVDGQGNAYIAGSTFSTNFLSKTGTSGTEDMWVIKLNPAGSAAEYITYLVGSSTEQAHDMVVDSEGSVYLTGSTSSPNFPTLNAAHPTQIGGYDITATKLNPSGQLVYSTYLGTNTTDEPGGMAIDRQGNAHIVGKISARAGVYKLGPNGNELYGVLYGGQAYGETAATGVVVNQAGEVIVAGYTSQKDLTPGPGAHQTECDGVVNEYRSCRGDVVLFKLNSASREEDLQILYDTYYGGMGEDSAVDLALGPDESVYITGKTISANFPTTTSAHAKACPSSVDPSDASACTNYEAFVAKFSPNLTQVVYSTYYGGDYKDYAFGIGVDPNGLAYITGWTEGDDLPRVNQIMEFTNGVCYTYANYPRFCIDSFVARFGAAGSLEFSTFLGGDNDDFANDLFIDSQGSAYVVGNTLSTHYPTTPGSIQPSIPGPGKQGFVTKIGSGSNPPPPTVTPTVTLTPTALPEGEARIYLPFLTK